MRTELTHPQPIHVAPTFVLSYFGDINIVFPIWWLDTYLHSRAKYRTLKLFVFLLCLCCFVRLLCGFFLCILSLIQTQTCRANHRTPLRYNCTYEEISQLHCSLLEASFLETPTLSLVLSAPAWPGPVRHSRRAVFLGLALSFPGFGSLGLHFPSFLMSPLTLPRQWIVSSPS